MTSLCFSRSSNAVQLGEAHAGHCDVHSNVSCTILIFVLAGTCVSIKEVYVREFALYLRGLSRKMSIGWTFVGSWFPLSFAGVVAAQETYMTAAKHKAGSLGHRTFM